MDSVVQQRVIQSALPLSVAPSGPTESDDSSTTESPHLSSSPEHTASESDISSSTLSEHTESSTSSDTDAFIQPVTTSPPAVLMSYKLVGDNIDKEVCPRDMRSDYQSRSLHYFHKYAVRDRVDLTEVSDAKKVPDVKAIQLQELLPTSNDTKELRKNFSIVIARTHKKHKPFFNITSHTYPDGFRQAQASGYARVGKMNYQHPVRAAKKHFRIAPCPENIIVHGEVIFDAASFRISPVLSKEKSVRWYP